MSEKLPTTGPAFSFNTDSKNRPLYYTYDREDPKKLKTRLSEQALIESVTIAEKTDLEIYNLGVEDGKHEAQKAGAPETNSQNPEIEKLKQQIQQLTEDMQAMQERLNSVQEENESLKTKNSELKQKLEEKQSVPSSAEAAPPPPEPEQQPIIKLVKDAPVSVKMPDASVDSATWKIKSTELIEEEGVKKVQLYDPKTGEEKNVTVEEFNAVNKPNPSPDLTGKNTPPKPSETTPEPETPPTEINMGDVGKAKYQGKIEEGWKVGPPSPEGKDSFYVFKGDEQGTYIIVTKEQWLQWQAQESDDASVVEGVVIEEQAENPTEGLSWREKASYWLKGGPAPVYLIRRSPADGGPEVVERVEVDRQDRKGRILAVAAVAGGILLAYWIGTKNGNSLDMGDINSQLIDLETGQEEIKEILDPNGDAEGNALTEISDEHGIKDSPDGDSLTEQNQELSEEHNDQDRGDDGGEGSSDNRDDNEGDNGDGEDSDDEDNQDNSGDGSENGNDEDDEDGESVGSAADGSHQETFNKQHGDRSIQSILPGNLEQETVGLHDRIIDKDTGEVIVEHVTYKANGPYSEATVELLRAEGYTVTSIPNEIYDTVGPGPRGSVNHHISVVR